MQPDAVASGCFVFVTGLVAPLSPESGVLAALSDKACHA